MTRLRCECIRDRFLLEELKEAIRPETILVSVMFVNNEIGAVEPIAGDRRADQAGKSENVFSCGCDSGLRKVPDPSEKDAYRHAFASSGHKIHRTEGTGFLYVSEKMKIVPIILRWWTAERTCVPVRTMCRESQDWD